MAEHRDVAERGVPTAAVAEAGDVADEDSWLGPRGCPNVIKP
jgi:hypothetical protein